MFKPFFIFVSSIKPIMKKDTFKMDVIFRKDTIKDWKGTIFALFPHSTNHMKGNVLSYQHIGQHSDADYQLCIKNSIPAKEEEYQSLKKELEGLGYNLNIIKRQNYKKYLKHYYSK